MKAICISPAYRLTVGKEYDVEHNGVNEDGWQVKNNEGKSDYYFRSHFKLVEETKTLPEEYIVEVGASEEYNDARIAWRDYAVKKAKHLNFIPSVTWNFLQFSRDPNIFSNLQYADQSLPVFLYSEWKLLYNQKQTIMPNFKQGDVVELISKTVKPIEGFSEGNQKWVDADKLDINIPYVVDSINNNGKGLRLVDKNYIHATEYFKLANMKKKVVANRDVSGCLTKGKIYNVISEDDYGYTIILDSGTKNNTDRIYLDLPSEKKIIGYLAPMDLFEGKYKKGQPWIKNPLGTVHNYRPNDGDSSYYVMPPEVVEKDWEPIYEDEDLKMDISGVKLVVKKNGAISFETKSYKGASKILELKAIVSNTKNWPKIGGYDIKVESIHIGCSDGISLTIKDIESIIDQFNSHFKK